MKAENLKLKARVAELLQGKKGRKRCSTCYSGAHLKEMCPKRSGLKDILYVPKQRTQVERVSGSVQNRQQRRKQQYCLAGVVPSEEPVQAARANPTVEQRASIQNPRKEEQSAINNDLTNTIPY